MLVGVAVAKANKRKLSNFLGAKNKVTSLSGSPYPDNFCVGKAIGNGSCFFDSFRQSLEQQIGKQATVKQLRENYKEFAQNNPTQWFIDEIGSDSDGVDGKFVNRGITCGQYINSVEKNEFCGAP